MKNIIAFERWTKDVDRYNNPHLRLKVIATIVNSFKPSSVVDLGCARGTLRTLLFPEISYSGVDFILPKDPPGFPFYQCDFNSERLPKQICDTDVIVCSGLLEYIEQLPEFVRNISDCLNPGGLIVASYFNFNHIQRRILKVKGKPLYYHSDWRGFYSYSEMKKIFKRAGFALVRTVPIGHSFSHSAPVERTLADDCELHKFHFLSPLMTHQFIFILKKN